VTRRRVVLYNPRAVFHTMPLALVAIGSALDPARYDVRIVDGRLADDALPGLLAVLDGALCLGVTVLTGAPIRDALRVTRAVRARWPRLPIVWGGWHPSLFPTETLADEAGIDLAVHGQGEATLREIVDRLAAGEDPGRPAGSAGRVDGRPVRHPARPLQDLNALPAHDYGLIPVERYFQAKGRRQLDYVSSQGCRFRCTFCADPFVYERGWVGLEPARVGEELAALARRHGVEDVAFQDETFFTSPRRVAAIAEELRRRDLAFTWTATLRADQGARLDEGVLAACRQSGLRRVMVGVESGSQAMLDRMKKDVRIDQVLATADRCRRLGVAALFNLIVGLPDEPPAGMAETLHMAKRLRAMSPHFEVAVFFYKPYPGSELAADLRRRGHRFPGTLEEWAEFDYVGSAGPWVTPGQRVLVERFLFYQRLAWGPRRTFRAPLAALARWRCAGDRYGWPVEKAVLERLRPRPRLS
jgi:radical SAM superfamily enzyme YgiQ (UPF0313 family)